MKHHEAGLVLRLRANGQRPMLILDALAGSRIESAAGSAPSTSCFLEFNPPLREGREGDRQAGNSNQLDTPPASPQAEVENLKLSVVVNPFARALSDGVALNELLHSDPETGNAKLDDYVEQTRSELRDAVSRGSGICYLLEGARAGYCSPMQYGGYYLERDRELLEDFRRLGQDARGTHGLAAQATVLYAVGGEDLYLDFVSDLPADIFAWDSKASGFDSNYVRGLREGMQASMAPCSEIDLKLENSKLGTPNSKLEVAGV